MVPGLYLIHQAISQEYADCLLKSLPKDFLDVDKQQVSNNNNLQNASLQMHHFAPLPEWVSMISEDVIPEAWKVEHWAGNESNASIVQRYKAGEGICWHVDLLSFGDGVAILSLLSHVRMKFRKVDDHSCLDELVLPWCDDLKAGTWRHSLIFDSNSLLLMSGEARYMWEHTIENAPYDLIGSIRVPRQERISFTLRRVKLDTEGVKVAA